MRRTSPGRVPRALAPCLALAGLLAARDAGADLVHLVNGDRLFGTVVGQNATTLLLQLDLQRVSIPRTNILRIEQETNAVRSTVLDFRLRDGRSVQGRLLRQEGGSLVIEGTNNTRIEMRTNEVLGMEQAPRGGAWRVDPGLAAVAGRSRWDTLWHSALLPGWGQLRRGDTLKGWVQVGVFAGALACAMVSRARFYAEWEAWDAWVPGARTAAAYDRLLAREREVSIFFALAVAAWAWSAGDALLAPQPAGGKPRVSLAPAADGGLAVSVGVAF